MSVTKDRVRRGVQLYNALDALMIEEQQIRSDHYILEHYGFSNQTAEGLELHLAGVHAKLDIIRKKLKDEGFEVEV